MVPPQIPISHGWDFPTLHSVSLALENSWKPLTNSLYPIMEYLPKVKANLQFFCLNHQDSSFVIFPLIPRVEQYKLVKN